MRRRITHLKRRLFNFAAAISLVLCISIAVIVVRSFWCDDYAQSRSDSSHDTWQFTVESIRGTMDVTVTRIPGRLPGASASSLPTHWSLVTDSPYQGKMYPRALWFETQSSSIGLSGSGMGRLGVVIPDWILVLITGMGPALWFFGKRRVSNGTCPTCGYDLRATPERCPECGTGRTNV
jgi:hypothetical protein